MTDPVELTTERLILRAWRPEDRAPFLALNADPVVMEHFPAPLTEAQTDELLARITANFALNGWGLWAAERRDTGDFIGFIGLNIPGFDAPFLPGLEIGWRLAKEHWGQGFAPEGATEVLRFAFVDLALDEVLSFTTIRNDKSRRVMEKIGMTHHPDEDFDHPNLEPGHPVTPHVLYRITRAQWAGGPPVTSA